MTMSRRRIRELLADDEAASAGVAGLRYVSDEEAGFSRRRWGKGFTYRDENGDTVRDRRLRERFASLVIPPAWEEVWICRDATGHIQATGRDSAGRKQYIYHRRWQEIRNERKFRRLTAFGHVLPRLRRRIQADLQREQLVRRRVLAAVTRLLDTTLIRIGNDEYARDNGSYGLTTIRKKHVTLDGAGRRVVLHFPGKASKAWEVTHDEPAVVRVVEACMEAPGYELFKYYAADGSKHDVKAQDVNDYLETLAGAPVTAKDFRVWGGTVCAASTLLRIAEEEAEAKAEDRLARALSAVAERLWNTVAVCRDAYIHPRILAGFAAGELVPFLRRALAEREPREGLSQEESAVLAYLERRRSNVADQDP